MRASLWGTLALLMVSSITTFAQVPFKSISSILNADGRIELFAIGSDNAVWHNWQISAASQTWAGWNSLGGAWKAGVSPIKNADGRLEIFVVGTDNAIYHAWQASPGGGWVGWGALGGTISTDPIVSLPSIRVNTDGRLEMFQVFSDGNVYHDYQVSAGGGWSGWGSLGTGGGNNYQLCSVTNSDGRLQVFGATANAVNTSAQVSPGSYWGSWSNLMTNEAEGSGCTAAANADGRLVLFASFTTYGFSYVWQTSPGGGWISSRLFANYSLFLNQSTNNVPAAVLNGDGRLQLFFQSVDPNTGNRALFYCYQTSAGSDSSWSINMVASATFNSWPPSTTAIRNTDGRTQAFYVNLDGTIMSVIQQSANSTTLTSPFLI